MPLRSRISPRLGTTGTMAVRLLSACSARSSWRVTCRYDQPRRQQAEGEQHREADHDHAALEAREVGGDVADFGHGRGTVMDELRLHAVARQPAPVSRVPAGTQSHRGAERPQAAQVGLADEVGSLLQQFQRQAPCSSSAARGPARHRAAAPGIARSRRGARPHRAARARRRVRVRGVDRRGGSSSSGASMASARLARISRRGRAGGAGLGARCARASRPGRRPAAASRLQQRAEALDRRGRGATASSGRREARVP